VQVRIWQVVDGEGDARELVQRLAHIPGVDVDVAALAAAGYRKKLDLPCRLLLGAEGRSAFLYALAAVNDSA
jgi:hypothetical protein